MWKEYFVNSKLNIRYRQILKENNKLELTEYIQV